MCGILGAATVGVDQPEEAVAAGLKHLAHRGPEAAAHVAFRTADRGCVLGHTRLRIIDVREQADQPIQNEDGSVQVVFNGELYNFRELRAELSSSGHRFGTDTDTEVLVHLYEAVDGNVDRMLERLRGMFAFALWDASGGRLVVARDRLGIKPMYHAAIPSGGVAFASEAMALVRSGLVDAGPDTTSMIGYLLWGSVQGPRTILGGVQELPPGSYLEWDERGSRVTRWWQPVFREGTDAAPAERLRSALDDAVARHLVADREVGLFLSGGVDSTAIANVAARAGALRSLTVTFPGVGNDEGAEAARTAASLGLRHDAVPVTGDELAANLTAIAGAMDQPTADGVNSWVVSRAAHDAGLVVALSGVGGDELFGGYPSFQQVPRVATAAFALRAVPFPLRRALADALLSPPPRLPPFPIPMAQTGVGPADPTGPGLFGGRDLPRLRGPPRVGGAH